MHFDSPMNLSKKLRLGDMLVQNGIISEAQLLAALNEQRRSGRKLGRTLIELGFIDEDSLLEFLSRQLRIRLVDLKHFKFKPDVVRRLPETHARRFRAIVLEDKGTDMVVGMSDPTDIFAYDELARLLKRPVTPAAVRESDLLRSIDLVYRRTSEITTLAEELNEELSSRDIDLTQMVAEEDTANAPVVRLLQTVFEDAVSMRASDIHIEPDEKVLRIRQRIDGVLQEQVMKEQRISSALVLRLKLIAGLNIAEKRLPQDGRFQIRVRGRSIDVRLSTMPVQHGESVVMRLLDQSGMSLQLDRLGMPSELLVRFRRLVRQPHGMILVTGPTGSGKTTTLYAALTELNDSAKKVITVEDPVEYRLARINQVQVNPAINLSFGRVLRTALRQDPDIIMVGEMRDADTVELGLRAAITGHLVLSTLHTNDAVGAASRLLDMEAEGYLLATALRAVLAQRLIRRICEGCATDYQPSAPEQVWLRSMLGDAVSTLRLQHGVGCNRCHGIGYRGRIGVYELLELDRELAEALRDNDQNRYTRIAATRANYRPLAQAALDYAVQGLTTVAEVLNLVGEVADAPSSPVPVQELDDTELEPSTALPAAEG